MKQITLHAGDEVKIRTDGGDYIIRGVGAPKLGYFLRRSAALQIHASPWLGGEATVSIGGDGKLYKKGLSSAFVILDNLR
jgi:hypothetical protein